MRENVGAVLLVQCLVELAILVSIYHLFREGGRRKREREGGRREREGGRRERERGREHTSGQCPVTKSRQLQNHTNEDTTNAYQHWGVAVPTVMFLVSQPILVAIVQRLKVLLRQTQHIHIHTKQILLSNAYMCFPTDLPASINTHQTLYAGLTRVTGFSSFLPLSCSLW